MPCFTPLKAYRAPGGGVVFNAKAGYVDRPVDLACGQCIGCRLERSRQWALRCVHEAQLHDRNCFITLTYDQDHLPADGSVDVTHWQKFAKRMRKRMGSFRFLHCGEYGDENFRPHYHACIFGHDFRDDRQLYRKHAHGEVFTSALLEDLWGQGFTTVGHLTWNSAAYVARYVMKKATGKMSREQYRRIDLETGEEYYVKPEYVTMSRRPGLATEWFKKYKTDVYPSDSVAVDGKLHRPPAFYDRLLEQESPDTLDQVKAKRRAHIDEKETTPERLRVREEVKIAQTSSLRRGL